MTGTSYCRNPVPAATAGLSSTSRATRIASDVLVEPPARYASRLFTLLSTVARSNPGSPTRPPPKSNATRAVESKVMAATRVPLAGSASRLSIDAVMFRTNALTASNVPGAPPNVGSSMELDVSITKRTSAAVATQPVQSSHTALEVGVATVATNCSGGPRHTVTAAHTASDVAVAGVTANSVSAAH
jgi:hypothetical protein